MTTCAACGYEAAADFKFCPECGAEAVPSRLEQRKVVTVLFCDVVGSTALGESVDPEALQGLLARYFERMKQIVESQVSACSHSRQPTERLSDSRRAGARTSCGIVASPRATVTATVASRISP